VPALTVTDPVTPTANASAANSAPDADRDAGEGAGACVPTLAHAAMAMLSLSSGAAGSSSAAADAAAEPYCGRSQRLQYVPSARAAAALNRGVVTISSVGDFVVFEAGAVEELVLPDRERPEHVLLRVPSLLQDSGSSVESNSEGSAAQESGSDLGECASPDRFLAAPARSVGHSRSRHGSASTAVKKPQAPRKLACRNCGRVFYGSHALDEHEQTHVEEMLRMSQRELQRSRRQSKVARASDAEQTN
jgi:hypothetical protein